MTTALRPLREAVRFRATVPEDVPFLQRLYASTREEEMNLVPWTAEQKEQFLLQQFSAQKSHYEEHYPECQFLVIELQADGSQGGDGDAESIGRLYLDREESNIQIVDIALLPEFRGRGIGRMLLEEILAEGAAQGKSVGIYVENFNPARRLYDQLGFRHIADNGVYHQMEWRAEPK